MKVNLTERLIVSLKIAYLFDRLRGMERVGGCSGAFTRGFWVFDGDK
jgi:hypothetical protein